jgi:hypothetical protein
LEETITLGPEQLAVVGFGEYAKSKYDLGIQEDVLIPQSIRSVPGEFHSEGSNAVSAVVSVPASGDLRIVMRQLAGGHPLRTARGAPPNGTSLGRIFLIRAEQNGHSLPVRINYDKAIWSGLSWGVGEVKRSDLAPAPLTIRCSSLETRPVDLKVELYTVTENQ